MGLVRPDMKIFGEFQLPPDGLEGRRVWNGLTVVVVDVLVAVVVGDQLAEFDAEFDAEFGAVLR